MLNEKSERAVCGDVIGFMRMVTVNLQYMAVDYHLKELLISYYMSSVVCVIEEKR